MACIYLILTRRVADKLFAINPAAIRIHQLVLAS